MGKIRRHTDVGGARLYVPACKLLQGCGAAVRGSRNPVARRGTRRERLRTDGAFQSERARCDANPLAGYRASSRDAGARYLRELLGLYDGNLHLALAAYNYGPGRIARNGYNIPSGAQWYSGYIFHHLNYVLGNGKGARPVPDTLYSDIGQSTLLTFGEPYRAEAFIERLERKAPDLSLDWFRRDTGEFEVVMTYASREEFNTRARQLRNAGFRID